MIKFNMSPIANVTTPSMALRPEIKEPQKKVPESKYPHGMSQGQKRSYRKKLEKEERKRIKLLNPMAILVGDLVLIKPKRLKTDYQVAMWAADILEKKERRRAKRKRAAERRALRKQPGYVAPIRDNRFSLFYQEYIRSPKWRDKRQEAFDAHGRQCVRCGGFKKLQCHHLTYERLGDEDVKTDLEILCLECHEAEHGRKFGCRGQATSNVSD